MDVFINEGVYWKFNILVLVLIFVRIFFKEIKLNGGFLGLGRVSLNYCWKGDVVGI